MYKLVFNHRRGICRAVMVGNILTPAIIFLACTNRVKFMRDQVMTDVSTGLLMASVISVLLVFIGLVYIRRTFRTGIRLKHFLAWDKAHHRRLFLGLGFHLITLFVLLTTITLRYFATETRLPWFRYVGFGIAAVTFFLALFSNINLNLFEAKNYFEIFYRRHQQSDVREVLEGLERSEQEALRLRK